MIGQKLKHVRRSTRARAHYPRPTYPRDLAILATPLREPDTPTGGLIETVRSHWSIKSVK